MHLVYDLQENKKGQKGHSYDKLHAQMVAELELEFIPQLRMFLTPMNHHSQLLLVRLDICLNVLEE